MREMPMGKEKSEVKGKTGNSGNCDGYRWIDTSKMSWLKGNLTGNPMGSMYC
jgi:hypothetical protein